MTWSRLRVFSRSLAGHSHYHNTKHRKARVDAQRQTAFQKLSRDIYAAIKSANGERDPSRNPRLARALEAARKASMPKQRIATALSASARDGSPSDTILFEGVFPGGAGLLVRASATRRNAVAGEIRSLISRAGGELGKAAWLFSRRHTVVLNEFDRAYQDDIIMFGIDQGAHDVDISEEGVLQFSCLSMNERERLKSALAERFAHLKQRKIISLENLEPKVLVSLTDEPAAKFERLLNALDDHVDVVDVIHNATILEDAEET
ncbi:transcriptional regulator [Gracilaria domingensis]|nr:transcriptional regulator [Gracilaria domingensis]